MYGTKMHADASVENYSYLCACCDAAIMGLRRNNGPFSSLLATAVCTSCKYVAGIIPSSPFPLRHLYHSSPVCAQQ